MDNKSLAFFASLALFMIGLAAVTTGTGVASSVLAITALMAAPMAIVYVLGTD